MNKELYKDLDKFLKECVFKYHIKVTSKNNIKNNEGYTLIRLSYKFLADEIYIKNESDINTIKDIIIEKIDYLVNLVEGGNKNE